MKKVLRSIKEMLVKPKEIPNPVKWRFSVKEVTSHLYFVHLTAFIEAPWRLYSQQSHHDGPMPTQITFDKKMDLYFVETPKEVGTLKKEYFDENETEAMFYIYAVDFVQEVISMGENQSISGKIIYRPYTQKQCLEVCEMEFDIMLT
jgi:thiol:disulfide interchange protein DsbD